VATIKELHERELVLQSNEHKLKTQEKVQEIIVYHKSKIGKLQEEIDVLTKKLEAATTAPASAGKATEDKDKDWSKDGNWTTTKDSGWSKDGNWTATKDSDWSKDGGWSDTKDSDWSKDGGWSDTKDDNWSKDGGWNKDGSWAGTKDSSWDKDGSWAGTKDSSWDKDGGWDTKDSTWSKDDGWNKDGGLNTKDSAPASAGCDDDTAPAAKKARKGPMLPTTPPPMSMVLKTPASDGTTTAPASAGSAANVKMALCKHFVFFPVPRRPDMRIRAQRGGNQGPKISDGDMPELGNKQHLQILRPVQICTRSRTPEEAVLTAPASAGQDVKGNRAGGRAERRQWGAAPADALRKRTAKRALDFLQKLRRYPVELRAVESCVFFVALCRRVSPLLGGVLVSRSVHKQTISEAQRPRVPLGDVVPETGSLPIREAVFAIINVIEGSSVAHEGLVFEVARLGVFDGVVGGAQVVNNLQRPLCHGVRLFDFPNPFCLGSAVFGAGRRGPDEGKVSGRELPIVPVHDVCLDVRAHVPVKAHHLPAPTPEHVADGARPRKQL
jgi:hypothetical protein